MKKKDRYVWLGFKITVLGLLITNTLGASWILVTEIMAEDGSYLMALTAVTVLVIDLVGWLVCFAVNKEVKSDGRFNRV